MLQHVDLVTSSPRSTLRILDMASLGALVFSLLCILFLYFSEVLFMQTATCTRLLRCPVVHCPLSVLLCPLPSSIYVYIAYQIYFTVTIFNLLFVFRFGPDANLHPPCFVVNLFRLEYLNNCLQIALCRLRLNCFLLTSLPATPLLYINAALWKLRIYDFVAVQIVGIVGKVFPVAKHALYAVLYTQSVANYLCRTPTPSLPLFLSLVWQEV